MVFENPSPIYAKTPRALCLRGTIFLYPLGKSTGKLCGETSPKASFPQGSNPSFSANDYKNCSFVISDKHLKLQWIKGLKRLSFKPFFLICGNFATRLQNY